MEVMDLTPRGIRTHLGLNRRSMPGPAAYGHFGRAPEADGGFSWEKTDLVEALAARCWASWLGRSGRTPKVSFRTMFRRSG
jgi:S-adenosylmethionine synthetase